MENNNVMDRAMAPTPKFFKTLRTVGLVLAAVAGTISQITVDDAKAAVKKEGNG